MPLTPPLMPATSPPGVYGILLFSDQLPGLIFRPSFYLDASGQVYLTDDLLVALEIEPVQFDGAVLNDVEAIHRRIFEKEILAAAQRFRDGNRRNCIQARRRNVGE